MNHTNPIAFLSRELLVFVRDVRPTPEELVEWLGQSNAGQFHVLKKAGLLIIQDGIVRLSPSHSTADEKFFCCGKNLYYLDEDRIDVHRRVKNPDGTYDELLAPRQIGTK